MRSRADRRISGTVGPAISFVVAGYRRTLATMAATAFLGGIAEALFLITATRAAFAITEGSERVGVVAGWFLSVDATLGLAFALVLVRILLAVRASSQAARLSSGVVARVRHRLASAFLHAAWPVQQQQRGGSLQELMSTYSNQASTLMAGVNQGLVAGANLVALLGLAIAVDPLGALVLVVSVGLLGSLLRPLRRAVRARARANAEAGMELAGEVSDISNLGMEVNVFHVQEETLTQVDELITRARQRNRSWIFVAGLATPMYIGLAYLALIGALALVQASSATSLTSLGASMLVMLRSLSYGQALQVAYVSISSATPVIDELRGQLDVLEQGRRREGTAPVDAVGRLSADHVSFAYVEGHGVLHDLSFSIEPREVVGIVGPSGGGKSTLVQLLLGLREPTAGQILAEGRPISGLDPAAWARLVTFVPQEPHLIAGTVADNIRFFRPWVSDAEVEQAARMAHLHEDIERFPEGYARDVGDHGAHLSGGQRQRLCIARALVERPEVLILDEPTSALDMRSEQFIRATLQELRAQMAVVIIAHRLSTLDICDRIMVIQDGRLMGFDEPARLAEASDFYREVLELSGLR
jgi:ABC-type multidrug transport system fused ATPase/permease subunit